MPGHLIMAWAGLQQSVSPCILTNIVVLTLVLLFFSISSRQVLMLGLVFTSSIFLSSVAVRLVFDIAMVQLPFRFEMLYVICGGIFLYFGLGFFWDWIQCFRQNKQGSFLKLACFHQQKESRFVSLLKIAGVLFLGMVLGLVGTHLSYPNQMVYYAENEMMMPGQWWNATGLLLAYDVGIIFPLLLLTGFVYFLSQKINLSEYAERSWIKMIFASFYISIGAALIYLY